MLVVDMVDMMMKHVSKSLRFIYINKKTWIRDSRPLGFKSSRDISWISIVQVPAVVSPCHDCAALMS